MPAHRTRPAVCILRGCTGRADVPGSGRGYCIRHYHRWHRYGICQALVAACERPAVGHIGLCDLHIPEGIPT